MRASTFISLAFSLVLAVAAVFAVRSYLMGQQRRMAGANAAPVDTLVVAASAMRFGDRLRPDNLKLINWPTHELPSGAFRTKEDLLGKDDGKARYAMEAIDPGEPILATKVTGAGERATLSAALDPGMKALSIRVNDVLGVSGFVRPGDRVDVLLTRKSEGNGLNVDVLLQGVKVIAVDQSADDRKDKPSVSKTVTFEVTTEEAQKLTLAATVGTLSLALRNIASSGTEPTRPMTTADLGGGPTATELQQGTNKEDPHIAQIEDMVQKVDQRVNTVEGKLDKPQPAVEKPKWATVGVWNTTKRVEHRVGEIK